MDQIVMVALKLRIPAATLAEYGPPEKWGWVDLMPPDGKVRVLSVQEIARIDASRLQESDGSGKPKWAQIMGVVKS